MEEVNFRRFVFDTFREYLPTPKSKSDSFLDKVREKVKFYVPKMEEFSRVDLGKIEVKDYKHCIDDVFQENLDASLKEIASRAGHKLSEFEQFVASSPNKTAKYIAKPCVWTLVNLIGLEMKYHNSAIYVPFGYLNRFGDVDFKVREKKLDQVVVHELSHHFWYKLGGEIPKGFDRNWRFWNEGFATYCANRYFAEIYPKEIKIRECESTNYRKGRIKIEQLVDRYGKQIVLEVPRLWKEFADKD